MLVIILNVIPCMDVMSSNELRNPIPGAEDGNTINGSGDAGGGSGDSSF